MDDVKIMIRAMIRSSLDGIGLAFISEHYVAHST
jgi:hypothetical protein